MHRRLIPALALVVTVSSCEEPQQLPARAAGAPPQMDSAKAEADINVSKPCDVEWSTIVVSGWRETRFITVMDVSGKGLLLALDEDRLADNPSRLDRAVTAADCAVAGPTGHLTRIEVRTSTGAEVATYDTADLVALRNQSNLIERTASPDLARQADE